MLFLRLESRGLGCSTSTRIKRSRLSLSAVKRVQWLYTFGNVGTDDSSERIRCRRRALRGSDSSDRRRRSHLSSLGVPDGEGRVSVSAASRMESCRPGKDGTSEPYDLC